MIIDMKNLSISESAQFIVERFQVPKSSTRPRPTVIQKVRKISIIKPSTRSPTQSPKQYLECTLASIEVAIKWIFGSNEEPEKLVSREEAYSGVASLVGLGEEERLWEVVQSVLAERAKELLKASSQGQTRAQRLEEIVVKSERYLDHLRMSESVLLYLDQGYLKSKNESVYRTGVRMLRTELESIQPEVLIGVKSLMKFMRSSGAKQISLLLRAFTVIKDVSEDIYSLILPSLEEELDEYMRNEFQRVYGCSFQEYIRAMLIQRQHFLSSISMCNFDSTMKESMETLADKIVKLGVENNPVLIESSMASTIFKGNTASAESLSQISPFVLPSAFSKPLKSLIETKLPQMLARGSPVTLLGPMRRNIIYLIQVLSKNMPSLKAELTRQMNTTWSAVISADASRDRTVAKALLRHLDSGLRDGQDGVLELENVMTLFTMLEDDATFLKLYQHDLSRRLLGRRSSLEKESTVVEEFGKVCGKLKVEALETMINDLKVSADLSADFRTLNISNPSRPKFDFRVSIGTDSKWPETASHRVKLPHSLKVAQTKFEEFYKTKHANRKLTWVPGRDALVVRGVFGDQITDLSVNLFQASILLLFSKLDGWLTYNELKKGSGLDVSMLNKTLDSLVLCKIPVLLCERSGSTWSAADKFSPVSTLPPPTSKLALATPLTRPPTDQVLDSQLARPRALYIQACIVRHMKSEWRLSHTKLYKMVCDDFKNRGGVVAKEFKEAIEELMRQGARYLHVDRENGDYVYCV